MEHIDKSLKPCEKEIKLSAKNHCFNDKAY